MLDIRVRLNRTTKLVAAGWKSKKENSGFGGKNKEASAKVLQFFKSLHEFLSRSFASQSFI